MRVRVFSNVRFFVRVNVLVTLASVLSFFSSFFFSFGEGKGRGRRQGGQKKRNSVEKTVYRCIFSFFYRNSCFYPFLVIPYHIFSQKDYFDEIIGFSIFFFFFLSPLEYSIDHDFSFLDPKFGNSAYQIFFPFLNLEQSKEADIKSFPELISRNLIL